MGRKSREKKLRALMRESGTTPVAVTRRSPPGLKKMSAVLLEVAEPMLQDPDLPDDPNAFKLVIDLTALLWNASRPGSPIGSEAEKRMILDKLQEQTGSPAPPEVERLFDRVMERARTLYPDDERLVIDAQITVGDGRYHVHAVSTLNA